MPQREVIESSAEGLRFEFAWADLAIANHFGPTFGELSVGLGDNLIWSAPSANGECRGVPGVWIELLEHLNTYWLYLVLEQGYPFNVQPAKPSQLETALSDRWERISDARQSEEEEEVYAFTLSHNLAEATAGTLRPDLWLVREGGIFVVEAQTGARAVVQRIPSTDVKSVLIGVGDAIAKRLDGSTDVRSLTALKAWSNRDSQDPTILARIATGLSVDYLQQSRGAAPFEAVFVDPESSWFDDNVFLDIAYRCKGVMPPGRLHGLLEQVRAVHETVSEHLQSIGQEACNELAGWESTLPRPYQQGHALAAWLRARVATASQRVEPVELLSAWNVTVSAYDFSTRLLDAVAFWAHGKKPAILWNTSEKHRSNEGARRATLAHEICHLLVDRPEALPLAAVVGGAMERRLEQRANAFAAELLCPRQEAAAEYNQVHDVVEAVNHLTTRFGVSTELASLQLAGSGAVTDPKGQHDIEKLGPAGAVYTWTRR